MGNYLPATGQQRLEMLEYIGVDTVDALYQKAPDNLILANGPKIPVGKSELEIAHLFKSISQKNIRYQTIFRGAGAYYHYIPSIVKSVVSKETFVTAYTPYQAEIAQGILQSIFEYQTMICQLTDMDTSNASVYDGATAAAEAAAMCQDRRRRTVLISAAAHPQVIETIKTYCWASATPVEMIPLKEGRTDLQSLADMLKEDTACVYIQQPNYFGLLEAAKEAGEIIHSSGAKYIMGINPIATAYLKTPGECGADIAVGEGQPLGMPMSFGGPYLGFMAASAAMTRKLPGRIVGETTDARGNRAFVLTLQAREQHIRREKASSNICSNQALCAMTAAVYMAAMGPAGMCETARQCFSKAHYMAERLRQIKGFELKFQGEYFHEFVTGCPIETSKLLQHLEKHGILGGLPVEEGILWCTTEMVSRTDIDRLVSLVKEVCG